MSPALKPGDVVIALPASYTAGSIVVANIDGRDVIKRVRKLDKQTVYLTGDNASESTDSRHYGPVKKSAILGTIMIVFPKTTTPPRLQHPYGHILGRVVAGILVIMALVHLFRIDTLVPILDTVLPGGSAVASIITVGIITSEIFAIPFTLRMKLSPLANVLSGALVAFAPLWWLLVSIWSYGSGQPTGQLSEFSQVYATTFLVVINMLWVVFNYYTLYALGFNRLKLSQYIKT